MYDLRMNLDCDSWCRLGISGGERWNAPRMTLY
nr:MAG TPA: hypothetical protein [Caudoviricetes sp.]